MSDPPAAAESTKSLMGNPPIRIRTPLIDQTAPRQLLEERIRPRTADLESFVHITIQEMQGQLVTVEAAADKLFQPFQQFHDPNRFNGTGLLL